MNLSSAGNLSRAQSHSLAIEHVKSLISPSAGSGMPDPFRGQYQVGSLTGAVHLSNDNADVQRPAQRGQKPRVEQKGKCWLDPDFQYEYGLRKQGLSILLTL